jgi:hypothetical protein
MGSRSISTSTWPGMGSIHPAWVGDDKPLDVRPVRSMAERKEGFKALRGELGDQIGNGLV